MKKLGIFVMSLAVAAFALTSCGGGGNNKPNLDVLPDGMYVLGEAVGVTDINEAIDLLMCQGVNEKLMDVDKKSFTEAQRDGMYEKYLYLDANKEFNLVLLDGEATTKFGGELAEHKIMTDAGEIDGYWCALQQNVAMKVPADGFYHIVLDLNKNNGDLDGAGGAQIIIAPVSWGISGGMNGWGMTVGTKAGDKNLTTWTWANVEVPAGTEFKFKDEHGWKIWLDGETQQVSAHTNLGAEMKQGGDNIKVTEGGVYNIVLSWKLAKGAMANSYTMELQKAGDLMLDPASFVVGISGSMQGWSDPSGAFAAKFTSSDITDPATKAGTYVYDMTSVTFPAGATFKFRFNGNWLGFGAVEVTGVNAVEAESDQNYAGVEGTYNIKITAVWDGSQATSIKAEFTEGVPQDLVDIAVSANVPAGWEHCYLWAWDGNGNIFDAIGWPGQELTIENGAVAYQFHGVAAPLNVIFSNGAGAQTNDITDVQDGAVIDIQANLK